MDDLQITKCPHPNIDKDLVTTKHARIVHKIYQKMLVFVKTTTELVTHESFNVVLISVMRELNKHRLYGFEKRALAVEIMTLLLMELGMPHVVAHYTAGVIERQLETVYMMGFHKWKRTRRRTGCVLC